MDYASTAISKHSIAKSNRTVLFVARFAPALHRSGSVYVALIRAMGVLSRFNCLKGAFTSPFVTAEACVKKVAMAKKEKRRKLPIRKCDLNSAASRTPMKTVKKVTLLARCVARQMRANHPRMTPGYPQRTVPART